MLKQSSGSVKIFWLNRDAALKAVKRAVRLLAKRRPEVKQVMLFGSLARGDAVPGSDADLLMVLTHSDLPFLERIPNYTLSGVPVGVDVFPYTEDELARMVSDNNPFVKRAISEGITIFARRAVSASKRNQQSVQEGHGHG